MQSNEQKLFIYRLNEKYYEFFEKNFNWPWPCSIQDQDETSCEDNLIGPRRRL